jgi:O-antigen ligase
MRERRGGWASQAAAYTLAALLFASVLTSWVPERWPTSILEIGAFLLAQAWIVKLALARERPRLDVVLVPAAMMVSWGALQIACRWTVADSETLRATLTWGANLAILFTGLQLFGDARVRERFLAGLLWFAFAISLAGIVQAFTSNGKVLWLFRVEDPTYFMGPFLYHNHFAAFVEAVLPLALMPALENPRKRLWFSFVAAVMVAAVIVSASRSGTVIVAAEIAVIILVRAWKARSRWRLVISASMVILTMTAAIAAMAGWEALAARMGERDPYFDRLQMLRSSVDMIHDHGWRGVGLGNWPTVFPYYARFDDGRFANQAHNDWVQAAAEAGVIGLIAYSLLFAWAIRKGFQNLWGLGLVFVFVHALFDYPFQKPQIAALVFAMLAAEAGDRRGARTNRYGTNTDT